MTTDLQYAGFWLRLKAGLVDGAVFLPLIVLSFWALGQGTAVAAVVYVANSVLYFAYTITGHAVWGQTLGKHAVGIRVRDTAGRPIDWGHAWRRSAVDVVLGSLSTATYVVVLSWIPDADFDALGWVGVQERYDALRPWWAATAEYLYWAWLASEIVTVLFNRRRRALHDFIAGTVVVNEAPIVSVDRDGAPLGTPRGWRRALGIADCVMAGLLAALAALFLLAALGAHFNADVGTRRETLILACYAIVVAVMYALSARSLRGGRGWHWGLRAGACLLTAAPVLLLLG